MSEVEQFDLDDELKSKALKQKRKDDRSRELEEIQFVCSTKQGRKFYWRMLSLCHLFKTSFTGNNTTFFNEGERNIGIKLLVDLTEACPEMYGLMQKEYAESIEIERLNKEKEKKNG